MKAWHFLSNDKKLRYGDGRTVKAGNTYSCKGEIILCQNGMHGSVKILDALEYACGDILCRVDITGDIVKGSNKIAGRNRKVLWMCDFSDQLQKFARMCALDVIQYWDAPDVVIRYLKTGDEKIRDTAVCTAHAAAYAAAYTAAHAAADAAHAAAYTAADAAADAYTARKKQNIRLTKMANKMEAEPQGVNDDCISTYNNSCVK